MTDVNEIVVSWMTRIDERLEGIERRLVVKDDFDKLEDRVEKVESKTEKIAIKQVGVAATMTMLLFWIKTTFFGGTA